MYWSMGRHQHSPQKDDKNMLGNIGDLFVICMNRLVAELWKKGTGGTEC